LSGYFAASAGARIASEIFGKYQENRQTRGKIDYNLLEPLAI